MDHLLWVRQVKRLTCDLRITISTTKANQAPTKANGSIFKIKYGSGTVSDFYSNNIGGMSITDYTFAEVSDVSGQEQRKSKSQVYNINA